MRVLENVSLASRTTFKVGGAARYVVHAETVEDIQTALTLSRERGLPWYVIGEGSNILAHDDGYAGVLIHPALIEATFMPDAAVPGKTIAVLGAGVRWDDFVREAAARGLWGIENLAGIPGSVGAAPVQNIGAYGVDIAEVLVWVEVFDTSTHTLQRFTNAECQFAYRESRFKHEPQFIIIRAAFSLTEHATPHINYADIVRRRDEGAVLDTPRAIGTIVRDIRSHKFPDLTQYGTAGSFFKNPIISNEKYAELHERFPELPGFPVEEIRDGTLQSAIKIPIAWIFDHVFTLRGHTKGPVWLFETQPLVVVAREGATARDIDALARELEERVQNEIGITLEREVRMLGSESELIK